MRHLLYFLLILNILHFSSCETKKKDELESFKELVNLSEEEFIKQPVELNKIDSSLYSSLYQTGLERYNQNYSLIDEQGKVSIQKMESIIEDRKQWFFKQLIKENNYNFNYSKIFTYGGSILPLQKEKFTLKKYLNRDFEDILKLQLFANNENVYENITKLKVEYSSIQKVSDSQNFFRLNTNFNNCLKEIIQSDYSYIKCNQYLNLVWFYYAKNLSTNARFATDTSLFTLAKKVNCSESEQFRKFRLEFVTKFISQLETNEKICSLLDLYIIANSKQLDIECFEISNLIIKEIDNINNLKLKNDFRRISDYIFYKTHIKSFNRELKKSAIDKLKQIANSFSTEYKIESAYFYYWFYLCEKIRVNGSINELDNKISYNVNKIVKEVVMLNNLLNNVKLSDTIKMNEICNSAFATILADIYPEDKSDSLRKAITGFLFGSLIGIKENKPHEGFFIISTINNWNNNQDENIKMYRQIIYEVDKNSDDYGKYLNEYIEALYGFKDKEKILNELFFIENSIQNEHSKIFSEDWIQNKIYGFKFKIYEKMNKIDSMNKYGFLYFSDGDKIVNDKMINESYQNQKLEAEKELTKAKQKEIFMIVGTVCIIGLFFIILSINNKSKKEANQKATKATHDKEIAEQEAKSAVAYLNPHSIYGLLMKLPVIIKKLQPLNNVEDFTTKISFLAREVSEISKKENRTDIINFVRLNKEIQIIKLLLDAHNYEYIDTKTIDFEIVNQTSINLNTLKIPPLVIFESIQNIIKHGFNPEKDYKMKIITLNIQIENEKLVLNLFNSGEKIIFDNLNKIGGLSKMKILIEAINKKYNTTIIEFEILEEKQPIDGALVTYKLKY